MRQLATVGSLQCCEQLKCNKAIQTAWNRLFCTLTYTPLMSSQLCSWHVNIYKHSFNNLARPKSMACHLDASELFCSYITWYNPMAILLMQSMPSLLQELVQYNKAVHDSPPKKYMIIQRHSSTSQRLHFHLGTQAKQDKPQQRLSCAAAKFSHKSWFVEKQSIQ